MLLLIPLCCIAFAALTKTTSIVELDAWQEVLAGTLDVGAAGDIHLSYDTILYLEIAYTDNANQDGVEVSIEVSYGDDNWTLLTKPFITPSGTGENTTIDVGPSAGDSFVSVDDSTGFNTPGQKFFVSSAGNDEETVRIKSEAGDVITLCHDFLYDHPGSTNLWGEVYEYILPIPAGFAYVRVLINNTDADADVFYTTRLSKVTSL